MNIKVRIISVHSLSVPDLCFNITHNSYTIRMINMENDFRNRIEDVT
jgi:hypothetical protein